MKAHSPLAYWIIRQSNEILRIIFESRRYSSTRSIVLVCLYETIKIDFVIAKTQNKNDLNVTNVFSESADFIAVDWTEWVAFVSLSSECIFHIQLSILFAFIRYLIKHWIIAYHQFLYLFWCDWSFFFLNILCCFTLPICVMMPAPTLFSFTSTESSSKVHNDSVCFSAQN